MKYSTLALQYAEDVIGGKVIACEKIIGACKRFLADLERAAEGWDYYYLTDKAEAVCTRAETRRHIKGRWARKAETLSLSPFQAFILCNIFGWVEVGTDLRRFREAYIRIARKNGKSFLAACIGLEFLIDPDDAGAEVYSGATSLHQAMEVFKPAREMVKADEDFRLAEGIEVRTKNLSIASSGAVFEPIIRNPGDGPGPSCAIVDEYHEHETDALFDTMETGMAHREEPLMLVITTAGSNLGGPCFEKDMDAAKILDGTVPDETTFVMIFEKDEADAWDSDEAIEKANPNLDVCVSRKRLERMRDAARRSAGKQASYRTKHCNEWVGARHQWMNILYWQKNKRKVSRGDFRGKDCYVTIDLASKIDVATVSTTFMDTDETFTTFVDAFVCEGVFDAEDKRIPVDKYREFRDAELPNFHVNPGNRISQGDIEDFIVHRIGALFRIRGIGYDEWQAEYLAQRLVNQHGFGKTVQTYQQNVKNMSAPMKEVEAAVLETKFHHDGDPVLHWFVGNVMARRDQKENIYPCKDKEDSPNKIDGAVSMIMGVGMWMADEDFGSVYDERGLRSIGN